MQAMSRRYIMETVKSNNTTTGQRWTIAPSNGIISIDRYSTYLSTATQLNHTAWPALELSIREHHKHRHRRRH